MVPFVAEIACNHVCVVVDGEGTMGRGTLWLLILFWAILIMGTAETPLGWISILCAQFISFLNARGALRGRFPVL